VRRSDYFESVKGDQHSCLIYLEFDEHVTEGVAVQDGKTKLLDTQRVILRNRGGATKANGFGGVDYEEARRINRGSGTRPMKEEGMYV
jgi:hypothetical protein